MRKTLQIFGLSAAALFITACGSDGGSDNGGGAADSGGTQADSGGGAADSGGGAADSGGVAADSGGGAADSGSPAPTPIALTSPIGCRPWEQAQGDTYDHMYATVVAGSFTEGGQQKCLVIRLDGQNCHGENTTPREWNAPYSYGRLCGYKIVNGSCEAAVANPPSNQDAALSGSLTPSGDSVAIDFTLTPEGSDQSYTLNATGVNTFDVANRSCDHFSWGPDNGRIDRHTGCWETWDGGTRPFYTMYQFKQGGTTKCAAVRNVGMMGTLDQTGFEITDGYVGMFLRFGDGACTNDPGHDLSLISVGEIFGGAVNYGYSATGPTTVTHSLTGWVRSSEAQLELKLDVQNITNIECD